MALAGSAGMLVAAALPWVRSGQATRSSFELVRTAERLDLVDGAPATLVQGWYLLPLLIAGAFVGAAAGRWRWVATLTLVAGGATATLVAVTVASPLELHVGPPVAGVAAMIAAIGAAAILGERGRA